MLNNHSFDFLLSLCSYKQLNGIESMKMQFKDQYLIRTLFHNDCTTRRLFPRIYSYIFDNSLPPFVLLSFNLRNLNFVQYIFGHLQCWNSLTITSFSQNFFLCLVPRNLPTEFTTRTPLIDSGGHHQPPSCLT